jgi:hypothetical protein
MMPTVAFSATKNKKEKTICETTFLKNCVAKWI